LLWNYISALLIGCAVFTEGIEETFRREGSRVKSAACSFWIRVSASSQYSCVSTDYQLITDDHEIILAATILFAMNIDASSLLSACNTYGSKSYEVGVLQEEVKKLIHEKDLLQQRARYKNI
jgi:hypothetical protein